MMLCTAPKKKNSSVGIAVSVAVATLFMIIFQPVDIYGSRALGDVFNMLHYGIEVETGNEVAD